MERAYGSNPGENGHPYKCADVANGLYMGLSTDLYKTGIQNDYMICNDL
jgi:hypothetical protein